MWCSPVQNVLSPADVRDAAESNEAQYHVEPVYHNIQEHGLCVLSGFLRT